MKDKKTIKKEGFAAAFRSVLESKELCDGELRTLLYLILLGQRKIAYAQQSTVAGGINKTRRTIIRHYRALEMKGYITINRRLGTSSEVRFTHKALPMTPNAQGWDEDVTQVDNISKVSIGLLKEEITTLVDYFELNMRISPGEERANWERCFADILERGILYSALLDAIDYVATNHYWRHLVHSPLFFMKKDRNGTEYIIRFNRESKSMRDR